MEYNILNSAQSASILQFQPHLALLSSLRTPFKTFIQFL